MDLVWFGLPWVFRLFCLAGHDRRSMGYFIKCLMWLVDIGQRLWWQWVLFWGCLQTFFEKFSVFFLLLLHCVRDGGNYVLLLVLLFLSGERQLMQN